MKNYDCSVVVVGAGPAGLAAAISAKKNGAENATENSEIRKRLVEEMADVLMYFNDVMLCYNISEEELKKAEGEIAKIKIEDEVTSVVYRRYNEWCLSNSLQPLSNGEFSKQVKKHFGFKIADRRVNGKKCRIFVKG